MISPPHIPITVLLITYNEERNIREALRNVSFANEIILVDSFSTDATLSIAATYKNVKIVQHSFVNYAAQRNFAIGLATHSWILFLDADERITASLQEEIKNTIATNNPVVAYQLRRTSFFKNKIMRFSGKQNDKIHRLFRKENAYYDPQKTVHEKLIITGKSGVLQNKLLHYSYADYSSYKHKMEQYGKMKALEAFQKGVQPNAYHYYIRPLYQFFYQYCIRFGFLDGKKGVIICYLNAYSVYVRFQKLKELAG